MLTSYNEIKNKIVETKSGIKLGKVCNLIINTDQDFITQYEVKPNLLGGKHLLISRDQIIRHTENKIIVEDNIKPEESEAAEAGENISPELAPMV